jgi:transposase-like protein
MVKSMAPVAGVDYPRTYGEFLAWFPDDAACLDYLDWLRWPEGFSCPFCGGSHAWRLRDRRWWCEDCRRRVSATSGTIFHRTRTPLTVWFTAAWQMTASKGGVSASELRRQLEFGSYQTIWAMLHRFRACMVIPGRELLSGTVEMDETEIGGVHAGVKGRGALGKTLVAVAVEQNQPMGLGRCRLGIIPDASAKSLLSFAKANIEPGSDLLTDGWSAYPVVASRGGYEHLPTSLRGTGTIAHVALPGVHRIAALVKRWLLGTHQGAVEGDHLQAYLDEFTFRFNRRHAKSRQLLFYRLLQQAVSANPITYRSLVVKPTPKRSSSSSTAHLRQHTKPNSLAVSQRAHPWRSPH